MDNVKSRSVCLICINYNSYNDLALYAESIRQAVSGVDNINFTFCVVDNSIIDVDDKILSDLESNFPGYKYFKLPNIGYLPGAYFAFTELCAIYDFTIVSNVDLELSSDFFKNLITSNHASNVGVIAPCIYSSHRCADLNPKIVSRVSKQQLKRTRDIFSSPFRFYLYGKLSEIKCKIFQKKSVEGQLIYAPHGSLMIFTAAYFKSGANINYPRFLFGEEVFVGESCLAFNLKVRYAPDIKVFDKDHGSTSLEKIAFISAHHVKSLNYLLDRYFN
ncbi:glycosyltransferase family 2 protein [Pseudomonas sp.]|uniref:glycosyltransferase family 2 protein n=1 Tax=Pseudomonas sp. TaxID=306 RepID=UPI003A97D0D8